MFSIGKIFIDKYPPNAAIWCNKNNAYIEEIEPQDGHRRFQIVAIPEPTEEELAKQALAQAKAERAEAVSRIVVEVDGMVFDGDKTAQQNMSEAVITAMSIGVKEINAQYKQAYESGELAGEYRYIPYEELTTPWVLADNTVATVTVGQLERALGLAKMQLTPIWIKPYQPEESTEEVSDGSADE